MVFHRSTAAISVVHGVSCTVGTVLSSLYGTSQLFPSPDLSKAGSNVPFVESYLQPPTISELPPRAVLDDG